RLAGLEIIAEPPQVPDGVVIERMLHRLARLGQPRFRERFIVGGCPLGPTGASAVIASVDGDADDITFDEVFEKALHARIVDRSAGAVQDYNGWEFSIPLDGPADDGRDPFG